MSTMKRFLRRKATSDVADVWIVQLSCFGGALVIFVSGVLSLVRLELSELQLVFGLLLTLTVFFLAVILGMVAPLVVRKSLPRVGAESVRRRRRDTV